MQSSRPVVQTQYPVTKILIAGVIAIVLSIFTNLGLRRLGMLIFDIPSDVQALATIYPILVFTAIFIAVATLAWFIVTRASRNPLKTWNWVVLIGFVVSILPDLSMLFIEQPVPGMGTFTSGVVATLISMHIISGFITWRALPRFSRAN